MHHLLLPVNNFFQSFFSERRFGTPLFPAPWGFLRAAVPQREDGLCLRVGTLSNTFFEFFEKSLCVNFIILFYLKLYSDIFHSSQLSPLFCDQRHCFPPPFKGICTLRRLSAQTIVCTHYHI